MTEEKRTISLREDLFHRLFNKHRDGAFRALDQLLPMEGLQEISSEIFPKKVPDRVYRSVNWEKDPQLLFLDLTLEVQPDDIYKMNTYRSWGLERVAEKLPRRRKFHEPEERVHGSLLSIMSPDDDCRRLAQNYHVDILSLQDGLPLDIPLELYPEVGAPFVLGKISWLRNQVSVEEWIDALKTAAKVFHDDEEEMVFLLGWARVILTTGTKVTFIKQEIEKIIREELKMSTTSVVKKILTAWNIPPVESKLIMAALEGMDAEQRRIVLAALDDMDEKKKRLFLKMLDLPPEKIDQFLQLMEEQEQP